MINVSKTMESIFLAENVHFWFTDDVAHVILINLIIGCRCFLYLYTRKKVSKMLG